MYDAGLRKNTFRSMQMHENVSRGKFEVPLADICWIRFIKTQIIFYIIFFVGENLFLKQRICVF